MKLTNYIRESGAYNMWSPQAREATGLSKEAYAFVMDNYTELREAHEKLTTKS